MEIVSPDCPVCGTPPQLIVGVTAFCGVEDCEVLSWNRDRTVAENKRHWRAVDLSRLNGDDV